MPKPTYFDRLKQHPGVPVASMMTVIGGFAGAASDSMSFAGGFVFGACIFAIVTWPIVLWTARTQPVEHEGSGDE